MHEKIAETIEMLREHAATYYSLTGKPIGITGEIGEYDAIRLLNMNWANVRQAGYDALKPDGTRVQIKTRAINASGKISGRTGAIKTSHEWDTVMLVIMDKHYHTTAIYEADRPTIEHARTRLSSKARNEGKLAISEFIRISRKVWPAK